MYFPGGDASLLRSSRDLQLRNVDFVIRSGRAPLYPVYKGTYERNVQVTGMNDLRDLAIARIKDARRSIDYLASRADVDKDRLAFFGVSLGSSTAQLPLFRLLGSQGDRKELVTFEGGQIPLQVHDVIRRILEWFDKYLGPVAVTS
jgi:dienelactone hydrolase